MKQKHLHIILLLLAGSVAHADWKIGLDGAAMLDGNGYQMQQSVLQLEHTKESQGQALKIQWSEYALQEDLNGIYAFSGGAPSLDASLWTLQGFHWFYGSIGSVGFSDLTDIKANLTYAQIINSASNVWKPSISIKREAFTSHPLPLSLETMRNVLELGLTRANQYGELTAKLSVEQWQSPQSGIRTQNDTLLQPPEPIITQALAYWLPSKKQRVAWGWAGHVSHSNISTQQATKNDSLWEYSWYPAAAPIWSGSFSALANLAIWSSENAQWNSMITLPILSGQVRQWDTRQIAYWGTAPFKVSSTYSVKMQSWRVGFMLDAELAPWSKMQFISADAYQMFQLNLKLEKNF